MLKKSLSFFIILLLCSCSAHLREKSFIAQDKNVVDYSVQNLSAWQHQFSNDKLKKITLKDENNSAILKGLFLDNPNTEELIFLIQGNGMTVEKGGIAMLKTLSVLEKDIVIFDRRGLGASSGKATIANLITDIKSQYQYIKSTLKPKKIIVHGYSLGSFIAAQLAKSSPIDALVLQGSATNVDEWIDARMPWYSKLFVSIEVDEAFKTVDNKSIVMHDYTGPLLIIAGEKDQQAPAELGLSLFTASQSKNKQLIMVKGADHSTMLDDVKQINLYKQFLQRI